MVSEDNQNQILFVDDAADTLEILLTCAQELPKPSN